MTPQAVVAQQEVERQAYRATGLPAAFVDRIFSVPPNGVWYPPRPELIAAGFVTIDTADRAPAGDPPARQPAAAPPTPAQGRAPPAPVLALAPDPGARFQEPGRSDARPLQPRRPDAVARRPAVPGGGA